MWYFDPKRFEIYWLTGEDRERPPINLPETAPVRSLDLQNDYLYDRFFGTHLGHEVEFSWIISANNSADAETTKEPFPTVVTLENLAKFCDSSKKKSNVIALNDYTVLSRSGGTYYLVVDGIKTVSWVKGPTSELLVWHVAGGALLQHQVDALNTYLGSGLRVAERDGVVGVEKNGEWVFVYPQILMSPSGELLDKASYQEMSGYSIPLAKRISSMIDKYVDSITPEKIYSATKGMKGNTHPILTRCDGCQSCNGMHLEVHMARGDLDAYLMYAAYDAFGSEVYGGPLRNTWNLISIPSQDKVSEFKEVMRKFLWDILRQRIPRAMFMPMQRRQGAGGRWQLYSHTKMAVDGDRLVVARRENPNEDGLRDGEWLAHELAGRNRDEEPPRRRPQVRRREVAFVGAEVAPVNIADVWEPDPFDVELNLEEEP